MESLTVPGESSIPDTTQLKMQLPPGLGIALQYVGPHFSENSTENQSSASPHSSHQLAKCLTTV